MKVVDPQGRDTEARITVEERDGRKIERDNETGGVKFCDLGISPVTVTVGHPACNQVTVRNVPVDWGETRTVSIIYDRKPCLVDLPPVAACKFLLRFVDPQHVPIKGVLFKFGDPKEEAIDGDEYGRVLARVPAWQELIGAARAKGYVPAEVRIPCTTENQSLERYVTLRKAER